jgi:hypothetical protein
MRIEQAQLSLSAESLAVRQQVRIQQPAREAAPVVRVEAAQADQREETGDARLYTMKLVAKVILGRDIPVLHASRRQDAARVEVSVRTPGEGATVDVRAESEHLAFQARGSVQTADGRRIDFQAELSLYRERVEVSVQAPQPSRQSKDPLVLNFDGLGPRLAADRIDFDLDADGRLDSIARLRAGSGYLFLDRNGDRKATDGSELFGPRTGSGFAELAEHDIDANGWIDEADPVFGELRVWFQDQGAGSAYSLADLGVGAISTSSAATQFDLRTAGNELLGEIRASGVYLREDGRAGVVSHVDLVV